MDNLAWGLGMTVAGMGIVFALLVLLWGLLALTMRLEHGPPAPADAPAAPADTLEVADADVQGTRSDALDRDLVAAIAIAAIAHKSTRRQAAAPVMRSYWPGSLLYASRWVASGRMRQNGVFQRRRG
jgi:Na+-transporting methylmalonyl-CoA/oxaloacetate decarboxylase gamma subunit